MAKIKEIYSFSLNKKITREVTEQQGNTKVIKTVEEERPIKVIFKNPSRPEREDADMVYAVEYGRCVRAGVLTSPLIEKLYDEKEKSGILSDDFAEKYLRLYERFFEIQNEFTALDLKSEKGPDDEKRLKEVAVEFSQIKRELQGLESSRNSLFQNTAETKAQNKAILWLTLFLTYIQEPDREPTSFFKTKTFEERLDEYDEMIDGEDDFASKVIDKMSFFVALWYMRKASSKEDFTQIENELNENSKEEKEAEVAEAKTGETQENSNTEPEGTSNETTE